MDLYGIVVNAILSFDGPFTYQQLIEKLKNNTEIDLSKKDTNSCVLSKIQEIFELSSIKLIPFSNPTKYFVDGKI